MEDDVAIMRCEVDSYANKIQLNGSGANTAIQRLLDFKDLGGANVQKTRRVQPIAATHSANFSAGV
jgi:hypothetical protein